MNAAEEYAAHQQQYDAAMAHIQQGDAWFAQWCADVADAAAQIRAEVQAKLDARDAEGAL